MNTGPAMHGWQDAVEDAIASGDRERVVMLGVLSATLLDLAKMMPRDQWEDVYAKISEVADVRPAVTLVLE